MENLIEQAVLPLKQDAIDRAERDAKVYIENMVSELKAANWDLRIAAPWPRSSNAGRVEYMTGCAKHRQYSNLTGYKEWESRPNLPLIVHRDSKKCAKFVEDCKAAAAVQYDEFVKKLVGKIGPVNTVMLTGNHVWGYSLLDVTLLTGEQQRWKTQQIVNVSKLGKYFAQWPSRQVKIS